MKNLKKLFATSLIASTLLFGSTFANAGIIIAGYTDPNPPCTDTSYASTDSKKTEDYVSNLTGIIIAGFTGIIIAGATDTDSTEVCGIIIAG